MKNTPIWRRYLTFWGPNVDRDVEGELRFHLEMRTRELIDRGMDPKQARDEARRAFGDIRQVRSECNDIGKEFEADMRRTEHYDHLKQDLSFGLRQLRRNPGFATVAVLTLALGIGANTGIFSIVNAVLLQPLQYPNAGDIYTLWQNDRTEGLERDGVAPANFGDWKNENRVFRRISATRPYSFEYKDEGRALDIPATLVTEGFFEILGVEPIHGRTIEERDFEAGNQRVFVISHPLWQQQFGADPGVVGRTLDFGGVPFTVVGVMPPEFEFPSRETEIWAPYLLRPEVARRASGYLGVIAEPKEGVTAIEIKADMDAIAASLARRYPESNTGIGITVVSLRDHLVGHVRGPLIVLVAAVGFVLLIACSNVACLMLMRGSEREQEFAVRAAVGAGRTRILRQLAVESMVLAGLGGGLGVMLALWIQRVLPLMSPSDFPRIDYVQLDTNVMLFTALVSIGAALISSLAPLARLFAGDTNSLLKESRRNPNAGGLGRRLGGVLVVSEIALALVLLIGAGLLGRSFLNLLSVDPGFVSEQALTLEIHIWDSYPAPEQQANFLTEILTRMRALPGVVGAGAASVLPFHSSSSEMKRVFSTANEGGGREARGTDVTIATVGYFEAMGIPVLEGRVFTRFDGPDARPVAVVTESAARRYWGAGDFIGRTIAMDDEGVRSTHEVIGVVADARHTGLDSSPRAEIFLPHRQNPFGSMIVVVRTEADALPLAESLQQQIWDLNPNQVISSVAPLDQLVDGTVITRRFYLLLAGLFAVTALVLASVGIYGVVTFSTVQKIPELGVRIAFGARPVDILRMVISEAFILTATGVLLGLGLSLALTRFIEGLLFDLSPTDPLTFGAVAAILSLTVMLACYKPARKATEVDPLVALRNE